MLYCLLNISAILGGSLYLSFTYIVASISREPSWVPAISFSTLRVTIQRLFPRIAEHNLFTDRGNRIGVSLFLSI